jgi:hypothetical protein
MKCLRRQNICLSIARQPSFNGFLHVASPKSFPLRRHDRRCSFLFSPLLCCRDGRFRPHHCQGPLAASPVLAASFRHPPLHLAIPIFPAASLRHRQHPYPNPGRGILPAKSSQERHRHPPAPPAPPLLPPLPRRGLYEVTAAAINGPPTPRVRRNSPKLPKARLSTVNSIS